MNSDAMHVGHLIVRACVSRMWRFLGVSRPDPPADPRPTEEAESAAAAAAAASGRTGMTYETKPVTYARYGEPDHKHHVTVCFVGSGSSAEDARWCKFFPEKFIAAQERRPFGELHPKCEAVLAAMRPVPPGARVHPDRNRLATGTTVSALLGSNKWLERDARAEGYRGAADLLVARAADRKSVV